MVSKLKAFKWKSLKHDLKPFTVPYHMVQLCCRVSQLHSCRIPQLHSCCVPQLHIYRVSECFDDVQVLLTAAASAFLNVAKLLLFITRCRPVVAKWASWNQMLSQVITCQGNKILKSLILALHTTVPVEENTKSHQNVLLEGKKH